MSTYVAAKTHQRSILAPILLETGHWPDPDRTKMRQNIFNLYRDLNAFHEAEILCYIYIYKFRGWNLIE